jgi:hypothetical protein
MFRGGRVDARGTGIASGLGYQKGGRVNYQMGGNVRGGIVNLPGGYFQTANERMEEWKKGLNNPYKEIPITLQDKIDAYTPSETPDWVYPKIDYRTGKEIRPPFPADLPGMSFPRDAEAMGVSEEFVPTKSKENGSNNLTGGDGPPEKTKAEKLEEYQKMFEEAYGTGRGEDISNMLLSFAGKALKPEATVKSSFGEFFEEEAKRPSERKKYKDAATTAAINAYLTGQKDYDSMMKQMKLIQYGNRDKITVASEAANLKGKDWESALSIVQDRYRGTKKRDSFLIVSETLKGVFGKPVDQKKGELGEIQEEDLIEGFTILTTKAGKIILEKIDGVIKKRPDLVI